jgi:hypothetical protein
MLRFTRPTPVAALLFSVTAAVALIVPINSASAAKTNKTCEVVVKASEDATAELLPIDFTDSIGALKVTRKAYTTVAKVLPAPQKKDANFIVAAVNKQLGVLAKIDKNDPLKIGDAVAAYQAKIKPAVDRINAYTEKTCGVGIFA